MTRRGGLGRDLIVAALVLSAVVHIGLMIWAKPKVMTHMTNGVSQLVRRGPMVVSEAAERPDPVKIDVLEDVEAEKESPNAQETRAALPAPQTAAPKPSDEGAMTLPTDAALPELLTRMRPEDEAPRLPLETASPEIPPATEAFRMPEEARVPVIATEPSDLPIHAEMVSPVFEAPIFAATPRVELPAAATEVEKGTALAPLMDETKKVADFKPVEEVMAAVDEKVVEQEKSAVRELVASASAVDLSKFVETRLDRQTVGGFTYFRVTVKPMPRLPVVPKDVVILIDASGSIGNERLNSCRKAARRILRSCTNTGDRFNLVAFRDRFSYAFKSWQACDAASFDAGDAWLGKLAAHGRTDVFATISSVLTLPRDPTRPLIALVVTDGDANVGVRETAQIISKFSTLNDGLVSVYMYGVKSSANRELIDVLTRGNRGESFVFDGWFRNRSGEGLDALSARFRDPVFSDLRIVFASTCPAEAYPMLLKNLYRDNSVEIVGRLPANAREVAFSLRGLAGAVAYEGFFRFPLASGADDATVSEQWRRERAIDVQLH